ncbi:MAG: orotidine-5'-phosphate decarboxylase [Acidobacteriia bacterium]|nr:orotidine-5'-phosphate decarboxylase [Terriglobia bacterium]
MEARDRLIVALDVPTAAEAQKIVQAVGDSVSTFKVGKQLFTAEGPKVVRDLVGSGRKVFLDLKFHDIPNTVAGAVRSAVGLGVSMLTVHASGGAKMLRAAADAAKSANNPPLVLAVTVLTSMGDDDLREIGVSDRAAEQVLRLAVLARNSGCLGVVASPQEVKQLRAVLGGAFAIVTPGVRPAGADAGDQARVATPSEAIRNGASHLVVGRPITEARDPAKAAEAILKEIGAACGKI